MKVLYTGSFNPFHFGHAYVYNEACKYFGQENTYIGIGINKAKKSKIDLEFIKWTLVPVTKNVIVYTGLTSDICKNNNIELIIRGIRPGKSIEYEEELYFWTNKLGNIKTIFIPTPPEVNQISSSVIRELKDYPSVKLDNYINPDIYHRWLNESVPFGVIYFGKSCTGKSTYLKKIHDRFFVECDKVIWDYVDLEKAKKFVDGNINICIETMDDFKREFLNIIKFESTYDYKVFMDALGNSIDYGKMFSCDDQYNFDAPVIGNYFDYIPKDIISKFKLIKISTSEENRIKFCKAKNWNPEFLKRLDAVYKDPPYFDQEIVINEHNSNI